MLLAEIGYNHEEHENGIRKIPRGSISETIQAVADLYFRLYSVSEEQINHGMCEDFAEDVCSLVPDATAWWDDELDSKSSWGHKVIKYRNKFYDSQCPNGTRDWIKLLR